MKEHTFYFAETNTDCTEGRGFQHSLAISECESTVRRLGSKRYIMGSDCPIHTVKTIEVDGKLYLPLYAVPMSFPTKEDRDQEKLLEAKREAQRKKDEALQRAKDLGLSAEDLKILQGQS